MRPIFLITCLGISVMSARAFISGNGNGDDGDYIYAPVHAKVPVQRGFSEITPEVIEKIVERLQPLMPQEDKSPQVHNHYHNISGTEKVIHEHHYNNNPGNDNPVQIYINNNGSCGQVEVVPPPDKHQVINGGGIVPKLIYSFGTQLNARVPGPDDLPVTPGPIPVVYGEQNFVPMDELLPLTTRKPIVEDQEEDLQFVPRRSFKNYPKIRTHRRLRRPRRPIKHNAVPLEFDDFKPSETIHRRFINHHYNVFHKK